MKRIFFVFMLFLLMAGCSSPYRVVTNSVDFSMYTDNGFFISESDAVPLNIMAFRCCLRRSYLGMKMDITRLQIIRMQLLKSLGMPCF